MAVRIDETPLITAIEDDDQTTPVANVASLKPSKVKSGFSESAAFGFGMGHVVIGLSSLGLGVTAMFLGCQLFFVATPAWTGGLFIATGIIGIVAAKKKDLCKVILYLVTSAMCIAFSLVLMIHGVYALLKEENLPAYGDEDDYGVVPSSIESRRAVDAIVIVLAIIEFTVAIGSASICAKGLQKVQIIQQQLQQQQQSDAVYMVPIVTVDGRNLNVATTSRQGHTMPSEGLFYIPTRKSRSNSQQSGHVPLKALAVNNESHA